MGGTERQPLAEQICVLLTVHAAIKEEIFYPAARKAEVDAALLDEAEVEHASCKDLIAQIRDMGPGEECYDAKVTVLGEYIGLEAAHRSARRHPDERRDPPLAVRSGSRRSPG